MQDKEELQESSTVDALELVKLVSMMIDGKFSRGVELFEQFIAVGEEMQSSEGQGRAMSLDQIHKRTQEFVDSLEDDMDKRFVSMLGPIMVWQLYAEGVGGAARVMVRGEALNEWMVLKSLSERLN